MKDRNIQFGIKNLVKVLGVAGIFGALFVACDVVEEPVAISQEPVIEYGYCDETNLDAAYNDTMYSDTANPMYKILLEDYTGHTCGNCPEAGKLAIELDDKYTPQIVVMGVHADYFAKPSNEYPTDFRTEEGQTYFDHFTVVTNPNGMVNRTEYSGKTVLGINQWEQAVTALKDTAQMAQINIETIYNSDRRIVYINSKVKFLQNSSKRYKIVAHLLEDHIIADQKDYSLTDDHVPDYDHRHVLRATAENSAWGKAVNTADVSSGDSFDISFDKLCVSEEWDETNCSVVVYIYDETTYEVVQVEEVHHITE